LKHSPRRYHGVPTLRIVAHAGRSGYDWLGGRFMVQIRTKNGYLCHGISRFGACQTMFVRAERLYGDELSEVHLMEVDSCIIDELKSFVEIGECNNALFEQLKRMMPRIAPLISSEDLLNNTEIRECLCAAYIIEEGKPVVITAKFTQQLK
jgi:hypothetical protein